MKSAEPPVALNEKEGEGDAIVALPTPVLEAKPKSRKSCKPPARPWDALDPNERPNISQTLRLNAYQHAQLKWIAEQEDRSLSQVLRRLIGPTLDSAV